MQGEGTRAGGAEVTAAFTKLATCHARPYNEQALRCPTGVCHTLRFCVTACPKCDRVGSVLRSWAIDKKGGLEEGRAREKAHKERVTALLAHSGFLYSVSYDGSVKMWDADSMELVMEARGAHEGGRVNCAAVGPDGNLYTGGDDKVCDAARLSREDCPVPGALEHSWQVRRAFACIIVGLRPTSSDAEWF